LTGLSVNTLYYVRAYATNGVGTYYSTQTSFSTRSGIATLSTTVLDYKAKSARLTVGIGDDGGSPITTSGICYSISPNPTLSNSFTSNAISAGSYTSTLSGLNPNTLYYARAYATNGVGTFYSRESSSMGQISFTTANLPTLSSTTPISAIAGYSAASGGVISSDGSSTIIARGVCLSTSPNPTTDFSHTTDGTGTGTFTSSLTGLTANTVYYARAYATNAYGTSYGNEIIFNSGLAFGSTYGGGLVFYNDGTGHGLISAPSDQSTSASWGCSETDISTQEGIYTGASNTNSIIENCATTGIAAQICSDLVLDTYSDWYMPSKDELNLMYINLKANGYGSFPSGYYLSSSQYDEFFVWGESFDSGDQTYLNQKSTSDFFNTRAIRNF